MTMAGTGRDLAETSEGGGWNHDWSGVFSEAGASPNRHLAQVVRMQRDRGQADRWAATADPTGQGGIVDEIGDTWVEEDISDVLTGNRKPVLPELGWRTDNVPLLYRGKEHSIAGEPESGKTWFMLMIVADILRRDGRVLYIDFEDDASTVVGRLLDMGVLSSRLKQEACQFRYVRPDQAPISGNLDRLLRFPNGETVDLVAYDGWTEGASLLGQDIMGQDDIARWRKALIRPALDVNAATITSDHVVKDKEARGRYSIGAQHKLAGLTGVMFVIEVVSTWGRGAKGRSRVLITKDRNGGLRQHGKRDDKANVTHIGDLVGDAESGEMRSVLLYPPFDDDDEPEDGQPPHDLADAVAKVTKVLSESNDPLSTRDLYSLVGGNRSKFDSAITWMKDNDQVATKRGPNRRILYELVSRGDQ
jgi:hypothetical protein